MSKFEDDINNAIESFGDQIPKHNMSKEESKPDFVSHIDILDKIWERSYHGIKKYPKSCVYEAMSTYYEEKVKPLHKELSELRKENEELHQSEILWFDRNADLESQLSESKERIEFLEMQLRHIKENKNTDVPF